MAFYADRDGPGSSYVYRRLAPAQERTIVEARRRGVPARALAAEYGVTVRTIYRIVARAGLPNTRVTVGTWHAEFVITDGGPVRVTAWHAAPQTIEGTA